MNLNYFVFVKQITLYVDDLVKEVQLCISHIRNVTWTAIMALYLKDDSNVLSCNYINYKNYTALCNYIVAIN